MKRELNDRVINIVLKQLYSDTNKYPVLYINFQPNLKKEEIIIDDNELQQILNIAQSKGLLTMSCSVDTGLIATISDSSILLMSDYGDYLSYLKSLKSKENWFKKNDYKNTYWFIGILIAIILGVIKISK